MIDKTKFFEAEIKTAEVDVPGLGKVHVRELNESEKIHIAEEYRRIQAWAVARACEEFDEADTEKIANLKASRVQPIYDAIQGLSWIDEVEEVKK